MFLDSSRLKDHLVTPIYNGLSDHDAQLLTIRIKVPTDPTTELKTHRNFNNHTISEFINKLSNESWDMVFYKNNNEDVNDMFNSFLNNYIMIFNSSFPLQTLMTKKNLIKSKWITKGIKISCSTKRKLYLTCRQHPNKETKQYYIILYYIILYYTILYYTTLYYTILYYTIQQNFGKCN